MRRRPRSSVFAPNPSETAMMVSGSLQIQMKDDKPLVARRGDFAYLPSRHVHRATCLGAAPCLVRSYRALQ
jgi:quercetin dioxygenase-like cupin family protein